MGASTGGPRYLGTVWAFAADGHGFIVSSPLLAGDRVITAVSYPDPYRPFGKVYCLDRLTGKLIWSFKSDKKLFSSPCLAEGRIYFGEGFHEDCFCKLYCLDAATGKKLWEFETESHTESSPCVSDGKVFFGAGDDGLYCLNALTGEKIWQLKDRLHIDASPLVVGRRLYVGSAVGDQYQALAQVCLDTATGQILWEVPVNLATPGAPTLDGEQVFFGTGNGNFLKRDENPGGAVICRRADNGQMLWQTPLPDSVLNRPAVVGGRVLVGSRDGHCYCLDRSDGHILWKHNLGSPVAAGVTLLTGSSGRSHASLFALGSGGRLACLHPETGEAFWTFDVSASKPQLFATPAVEVTPWLTEDHRRIYFAGGLQDNTRAVLYCLEDYWPEK
jgi:outer membrane protein assembly factor BamB